MKKNLIFKLPALAIILSVCSICLLFQSCSDDDGTGSLLNKENKITIKVYSNTPEAVIHVSGTGINAYSGINIKNSWETSLVTKDATLAVLATCKDETVLITMEAYKNDKLLKKTEGNTYVNLSADIKKF
ncbi:hypothetical protein KRX57_10810 [Weeksellaceae bacterium TAE3-ERU29]|nr:hypothetical protein [Weeksellaceae bacterium TAE3-ERU29]